MREHEAEALTIGLRMYLEKNILYSLHTHTQAHCSTYDLKNECGEVLSEVEGNDGDGDVGGLLLIIIIIVMSEEE
jgi:hypothetical protein